MEKGANSPGIKVAVVGSRTFTDYTLLKEKLDHLHKTDNIILIVSGGAIGADKLAERWAKKNGIETLIFIPQWRKNGKFDKGAGYERNKDIIASADKVVAFWDGVSKGTKHSIGLAELEGKEVIVIPF